MYFLLFVLGQKMGAALDALSRVLEGVFPGWIVTLESDQIFSVRCEEYHLWVSKTVVRNHTDVLETMKASRTLPGTVREWVRHGYIVAAEYWVPTLEDASITRVDIK